MELVSRLCSVQIDLSFTANTLNAGGMMGGVCEQLIFSKVRDEEVREVRDLINQSYREQKLETFSENIISHLKCRESES